MGAIYFLIAITIGCLLVFVVLPKLPHPIRVGFWTVLCVSQIVQDNALLSALYAAIAVDVWNNT